MTQDLRKIIVLSDLHIVPDGQTSYGLDTGERLAAALADIADHHSDATCIIIAGDLTDRGDEASYHRLARHLQAAVLPVHFLVGNHDERDVFAAVFPDAPRDEHGFVQTCIDLGPTRFVLIDTVEPGEIYGSYCEQRAVWLSRMLEQADGRQTVVIAHHHIAPLDTEMDRYRLHDDAALIGALRGAPDARHNIAAVISGHCHTSSSGVYHGLPMLTISGAHYDIDPSHQYYRDPDQAFRTRWQGPNQYGVIYVDGARFMLHYRDLPGGYPAL